MDEYLEHTKQQDLPDNTCDGNYKVTVNYDCTGGDIFKNRPIKNKSVNRKRKTYSSSPSDKEFYMVVKLYDGYKY